MVTAERARQLTQEFVDKEAAIQDPKLEQTLQEVEEAANKGESYIVRFNVGPRLINNLQLLGYRISYEPESGEWIIKW